MFTNSTSKRGLRGVGQTFCFTIMARCSQVWHPAVITQRELSWSHLKRLLDKRPLEKQLRVFKWALYTRNNKKSSAFQPYGGAKGNSPKTRCLDLSLPSGPAANTGTSAPRSRCKSWRWEVRSMIYWCIWEGQEAGDAYMCAFQRETRWWPITSVHIKDALELAFFE